MTRLVGKYCHADIVLRHVEVHRPCSWRSVHMRLHVHRPPRRRSVHMLYCFSNKVSFICSQFVIVHLSMNKKPSSRFSCMSRMRSCFTLQDDLCVPSTNWFSMMMAVCLFRCVVLRLNVHGWVKSSPIALPELPLHFQVGSIHRVVVPFSLDRSGMTYFFAAHLG